MLDKNKRVKVVNRTNGSLAYYIDTLRITRHWRKPGDYINISIAELLELKAAPGGLSILENSVVIEDEEALKAIFPDLDIEPEYLYGLEEIDTLLYEAETAQLLDALDYAPKGVLDLIKTTAVLKLPNTTDKIRAINEKFNIDLVKMNELSEEKNVAPVKEEVKRARRTKPLVQVDTPEPETPGYKVVNRTQE